MRKRLSVFLIFLIHFLLCKPDASFGPYDLHLRSINVCSGPKRKNCTHLDVNVTGDTTIFVNLKVLKTCSPAKGKIISYSSTGKEIARFQMSKPCEHLFLRPLLESLLNITKTCQVLKKDYSNKVDIGHIASNYFGGSFVYGNLTFRAVFYDDECNFSCIVLKLSMTPKQ